MPKWISINGQDGAISSQLQWSNQVSQSNQMPNLCNYYSFLVTCDMLTCLHFIDKIEMEWAITIRQYTSNNHQTIYHICNGQWLMPADSRRRWSGDCPFALFCLLLAICLLVALMMIVSHCLVPSWSTNILALSSRSHCCLQHDIGRILIDCAFVVFCACWFYH